MVLALPHRVLSHQWRRQVAGPSVLVHGGGSNVFEVGVVHLLDALPFHLVVAVWEDHGHVAIDSDHQGEPYQADQRGQREEGEDEQLRRREARREGAREEAAGPAAVHLLAALQAGRLRRAGGDRHHGRAYGSWRRARLIHCLLLQAGQRVHGEEQQQGPDHAQAHEEAELAEGHQDTPEIHEEAGDGADRGCHARRAGVAPEPEEALPHVGLALLLLAHVRPSLIRRDGAARLGPAVVQHEDQVGADADDHEDREAVHDANLLQARELLEEDVAQRDGLQDEEKPGGRHEPRPGADLHDDVDQEDAPHRQADVRPELVEEVVLVQGGARVVDLDARLLSELVAREHTVELALDELVELVLGAVQAASVGPRAIWADRQREVEVRGQHLRGAERRALAHLVVLRN
mmetsp:Transcript_76283/g.200131  ORF Transcript_76283/g.200131 Transcript_76283/m.200131 type:complete len:405 (-) Transcript_76283:751-1965(-)